MLAEAMIAARGVTMVAGAAGHIFGGRSGSSASSGTAGTQGSAGASGFLKGGLSGVVSRKITRDAVKTATTHTAAFSNSATAAQTASASHTDHSSSTERHTAASGASNTPVVGKVGLGGSIFASSLSSGGYFANDVIGRVARGDIRSTGSITGEMAARSLMSYMGFTALGEGAKDTPGFSNVEIGGGHITGTEVNAEHPEGIAFGMYHAEQYTAPEGEYAKVHSADGTLWYKQYAVDSVVRTPYKAPDGTVAYQESITKKLPQAPKRKDRI